MKKLIIIILTFICLTSYSNNGKIPQNTSEINFVVKTDNKKIIVEIYKDKRVIYRDRTSEDKRYYFVNVDPGKYTVKFIDEKNNTIDVKKYIIKKQV